MYALTTSAPACRRPAGPRPGLAALRVRRPVEPWRLLVRRVVMLAAALAILAVLMAQVVHGQAPSGYQTVTVRAGDTVWSIAAARYPSDDTRSRVDQILQANRMTGPTVFPGEHLRVPAS